MRMTTTQSVENQGGFDMQSRLNLLRAAVATATLSAFATAWAATRTVEIFDFGFNPATTNINVGDSVVWKNTSGFTSHTSTSDTGIWDVPVSAGTSSTPVTFNTAGSFPYHCTPHPFMTGNVI